MITHTCTQPYIPDELGQETESEFCLKRTNVSFREKTHTRKPTLCYTKPNLESFENGVIA